VLNAGIPLVGIGIDKVGTGINAVTLADRLEKACAHFADRGCARLGVFRQLGTSESPEAAVARLQPAAAPVGLQTDTGWVQGVDLTTPEWTANVARLLMRLPADDRPDAVLIEDDNLVEPVTAGIAAAGLRAPEDVDILAHANFPHRPPAALPVTWLGYDMSAVVRACVELIDRQRRDGEGPGQRTIPATFG